MTPFIASATTLFSALTVVADIIIACLAFLFLVSLRGNSGKGMKQWFSWYVPQALLTSFLLSVAGVLGSLFYSEIAGFAPCELCWWIRIFLFPQAIILGLAVWYKNSSKRMPRDTDNDIEHFALCTSMILSLGAVLVSLYLSYGQLINPDVLPACAATGVSCAKIYFLDFGYVSIPTMALTVSLLLILTAGLYFRGRKIALQ